MLKDLPENIRLPQSIFFIVFTLLGVAVSDVYEIYTVVLKILVIFFLWQYTVVINRICDEKAKEKSHFIAGIAFLATSLVLSFVLGMAFFMLSLVYLIAGTAYSVPPIRLRNHVFSTTLIGIGSVLAFLIGYYQDLSTVITYEIIVYCAMIFIATSLGSTIKDMKDQGKDREDGIKNIFTVFGPEKGKRISCILLLITFLMPLLVFSLPLDMIMFVSAALLTIGIFMKLEDYRPVMMMAFLVLLYCVLRLKGLI